MCCKTKINTPLMYEVLDKDTIKFEILPHLSVARRGYVSKSDLLEVIQCILYKLKTGCQWHMLPVSSVFTRRVLHYKTVYGHFRKWSRNGEWEKVWGIVLKRYKSFLDMSSVDLDGSHTTALRGGECCGYQGRKKRKTTNHIRHRPPRNTACHVHSSFGFAQRCLQHLQGYSGVVLGA